jgi:hypothetical protein
MGQPEKYRQYAAECLQLASDFREPGARAVLHHMAQVWLRLAQDAEGRGTNLNMIRLGNSAENVRGRIPQRPSSKPPPSS